MVPGDVGNAVDARIILLKEAEVLKAVPGEPVVGVGEAQAQRGAGAPPAGLGKALPHLGGRVLPPAVLAKQIAGGIPVKPPGRRAAVFEFALPPPEDSAAEG